MKEKRKEIGKKEMGKITFWLSCATKPVAKLRELAHINTNEMHCIVGAFLMFPKPLARAPLHTHIQAYFFQPGDTVLASSLALLLKFTKIVELWTLTKKDEIDSPLIIWFDLSGIK